MRKPTEQQIADSKSWDVAVGKLRQQFVKKGMTPEQFHLADLNFQDLCTRWEQVEDWGQPIELDGASSLDLYAACLDGEMD